MSRRPARFTQAELRRAMKELARADGEWSLTIEEGRITICRAKSSVDKRPDQNGLPSGMVM